MEVWAAPARRAPSTNPSLKTASSRRKEEIRLETDDDLPDRYKPLERFEYWKPLERSRNKPLGRSPTLPERLTVPLERPLTRPLERTSHKAKNLPMRWKPNNRRYEVSATLAEQADC